MTILIKTEASKRDVIYELKRFINDMLALYGQAFLIGRTPFFDARETLSPFDQQSIRKKRIKWLAIGDGADTNLLNDKTLFPNLKRVRLCSERNNAVHLKLLASNYPNVSSLTIEQSFPLLAKDAIQLKAFKKLGYIDLRCPHENSPKFWDCLPKTIEFLQTNDCSPNMDLPKLTELHLNRCRVDAEFFQTLTTPNLERLQLWQVDLQLASLKFLEKERSLKLLRLHNANEAMDDIQSLRHLEHLSICSSRDNVHADICWEKAEGCFQSGNFDEAEGYYQAAVFDKPSVYGYLQIARCRIKMGDMDIANRFCLYAASINPTDTAIPLVESEIRSLTENWEL